MDHVLKSLSIYVRGDLAEMEGEIRTSACVCRQMIPPFATVIGGPFV